jgi:RNA polymerase sigma-70 factor (ECF subfamily)
MRPARPDPAAFEQLLKEHQRIVLHVARLYAPHADDRAELIQEISTQLWRAYPGYDPSRKFSTWMYRIALNVGISWLRESSRRGSVIGPLEDDLLEAMVVESVESDAMRELYDLIATLDPINRALILLYLEDRPYKEISEVLGISESNVATKIARIKQQLRERAAA